ncbi:hypothetical protein MUK42_04344 [Musa troglodytarum]|uniref:Uncharacterized protein n=1 Tax=Musa troglodytarum TaxID=320322 RepID=A0A9E7H104_9LILI|nr:hypothetical protein MUK42_04344 [Musa troglodytarum]
MYTVPVHLLTLFAASALFCCRTLVRNNTKFTPTPKNASVANPWFTASRLRRKELRKVERVNKEVEEILTTLDFSDLAIESPQWEDQNDKMKTRVKCKIESGGVWMEKMVLCIYRGEGNASMVEIREDKDDDVMLFAHMAIFNAKKMTIQMTGWDRELIGGSIASLAVPSPINLENRGSGGATASLEQYHHYSFTTGRYHHPDWVAVPPLVWRCYHLQQLLDH